MPLERQCHVNATQDRSSQQPPHGPPFVPGEELTSILDKHEATAVAAAPATMIDAKHLAEAVHEIVGDMQSGACAATISQTVQVLDLGDGRKAAVIVTITTENDQFL